MMLRSIDKGKIYFYSALLLILLSAHNTNYINNLNNFFKINTIKINSNADGNLHQDVLLSLNKFYDYNIFSLNINEITSVLDNFNRISKYKIKKKYPSIIKVDLEETKILAYYYENNQIILIGENGKKIKSKKFITDNIPLVIGKVNIQHFLTLKEILTSHGFEISDFNKFYFFKSNRWDLVYKNKLTIKLPNQQLDYSINLFKDILGNKNIKNVNIIDLRLLNKVILS